MRGRWWVAVGAALAVVWLASFNALLNLTTNAFDLGRFRWWLLAAAVGCTIAAAIVAGVQNLRSAPRGRVWVDRVERGRVRRADLEDELVGLLTEPDRSVVAVGTALYGAGGFGKTTLARQVCGDRRVRRAFRSAVWVTVGEDPTEAYLREQINDVYFRLSDRRLDAQSLEQAGQELGRLLDHGSPVLMVVDDVWRPEHLRPFLHAGKQCTRLVTTRRPGVVAGVAGGRMVRVDEFTVPQARTALLEGLHELAEPAAPAVLGRPVEAGLLRVTGRWPLLVRMANRHLIDEVRGGATLVQASDRLMARLSAEGPATLSLSDENSRNQAAAASIGAGMARLTDPERTAFVRLGVFAEDLAVPVETLAMLWSALLPRPLAVRRLCERLDGLSLLGGFHRGTETVYLHDVVREFLRHQYPGEVAFGHRVLVEAARALVPLGPEGTATPWHELRQELTGHTGDVRVVAAASTSIVTASDDRRVLVWDPATGALRCELIGHSGRVRAVALAADGTFVITAGDDGTARVWDSASGEVRHTSTSLTGEQRVVALPAGAAFFATAGTDGTVRVWDPANGALRQSLTGHTGEVRAMAVPADGTFIVTAGVDRTVRVWDPASGILRQTLAMHSGEVRAIAVPADGAFIVTAGSDGAVRVWDPATGLLRRTLTGHVGEVRAVGVTAEESLIVTAGIDKTIRVWNEKGEVVGVMRTETPLTELALAADGILAAAGGSNLFLLAIGTTKDPLPTRLR